MGIPIIGPRQTMHAEEIDIGEDRLLAAWNDGGGIDFRLRATIPELERH